MTRIEKAKQYENLAKVVDTIIDERMYSEVTLNCEKESEFFEESCKFVDLVHELKSLTETWKNLAKYNRIIGNE